MSASDCTSVCVPAGKGKACRQHQWIFRINFGLLNKYTNRTRNSFSKGYSAMLLGVGFFNVCFKTFGQGGRVGYIGFYK